MSKPAPSFRCLRRRCTGPQTFQDYLPLIIAILHIVYSASSYPSGVLADRISARLQLGLTAFVLVGAHLSLAVATTFWAAAIGSALWGLQMGLSYGLLKAAVADAAPTQLRGTAFGIYDCAIGLTTFVASASAGLIWSLGGPSLAFASGAALAAAALVLVFFWPIGKVLLVRPEGGSSHS